MGVSTLPGPKPTPNWSDQITNGMAAFARYERQRQDMQMRDAVMQKLNEPLTPEEEQDPGAMWKRVVGTVSGYKPTYDKGLAGAFQRFGNMGAGPSGYGNQIGDLAVAQLTPQAQAEVDRTRAQAEYYKQPRGGHSIGDLSASMATLNGMLSDTSLSPERRKVLEDQYGATSQAYMQALGMGNAPAPSPAPAPSAGGTGTASPAGSDPNDVRSQNYGSPPVPSDITFPPAGQGWGSGPAIAARVMQEQGRGNAVAQPQWSITPETSGASRFGTSPTVQPRTAARNQGSGLTAFGNGLVAGFGGGNSNGSGGNSNPQPFGSGGGAAGFGNGVLGGLSVGSWGGPGQQTPSGVDESDRVATMKAQEGGGVVVTSPKRTAAPATPAPAQPTGQVFRQKSTGKLFQLVGYDNQGNPLYQEVQ